MPATKTPDANARTVAGIFENLVYNILGRNNDGAQTDRVMNGPTTEAFTGPWEAYLRTLGVQFRLGWSVEDLALNNGLITANLSLAKVIDQSSLTADQNLNTNSLLMKS